MNVGVLFMADSHHHHQSNRFRGNDIEVGHHEDIEEEKEKKRNNNNFTRIFPVEESSSSNNSSRKSSVNHSNRSGSSSSSSNNSVDTRTRNSKSSKKFQRLKLENVLLGPVPVEIKKHSESFPGNFHSLSPDQISNESSVSDPVFYYIKSSSDCPCAYHDQLRRIDEDRAIVKRAKALAKKNAGNSESSSKGSFYISSNSSSVSSLDYETPNRLREELERFHHPHDSHFLVRETALIHHGQYSPHIDAKTLENKFKKEEFKRMKKVQSDLREYRNRNIPSPIIENKISNRIRLSKSPDPVPEPDLHVLRLVLNDKPEIPIQSDVILHKRKSASPERSEVVHRQSPEILRHESQTGLQNSRKSSRDSGVEVGSRPRLPEPTESEYPETDESRKTEFQPKKELKRIPNILSQNPVVSVQAKPNPDHGKIQSDPEERLSEPSSPVSGSLHRQRSLPSDERTNRKRKLHRIAIALPQPDISLTANAESKDVSLDYELLMNQAYPAVKPESVAESEPESNPERSGSSSPDYAASGYVTSIAVIADNEVRVGAQKTTKNVPEIPSKYDPNGNWTLKPRGGGHANNVQMESSEEEISSFEEPSDVEEEESYISVIPSTPIDSHPASARSSSSRISPSSSCTCCTPSPPSPSAAINRPTLPSQPSRTTWQHSAADLINNRDQMNRFRIPDDDEIKICPPNFPPQIRTPLDYHTCYDGDIQRFLTRENPQLPLCLQNIILQHVQNAETSFPESANEAKMKKKMAKFFVVPEDPSDPVAFTETFPDMKRKSSSKKCCASKPVHKIVGFFSIIMTLGILVTIICVYHFTNTFRPMM